MIYKSILTMICISFLSIGLQCEKQKITAFDILDRIDRNMVFKTIYAETDMIITIKNRKINKSMISYSDGNDKSYIEFLSPARDKGTKILKLDRVVRIYYPSAERVLRLSGHMLRRSMMGSDFSYEDMTERATKMREEYSGKILGEETLNGVACILLELVSKKKKRTYFRRKMWVNSKIYVPIKEELYARSGKLLKVSFLDRIESYQGRYYPTRIILEDKLRKNSKTEIIQKSIRFNVEIPKGKFNERQLLRR